MALPFWPKIVTSGPKENFELSLPLSLLCGPSIMSFVPAFQCR